MQARAPVAPVSPAYSMMSTDHAKLKYVFDLIKPGMVFVQNGPALRESAGGAQSCHVSRWSMSIAPPPGRGRRWRGASCWRSKPTEGRGAIRSPPIDPRTVGKFLFTSGSTDMPKAVINTQEMMCANLRWG